VGKGKETGKVYFVGAGPGDADLITVKGAKLLQEADCIIYDRLVNKALLRYGRVGVELIYCGKSPNQHTLPQERINHMLVDQARQGKMVVRLKGGDPALFGRVGEEAAWCADHGIPFEIVPGVTSGVAAPIYAGIPLTHRTISSSVALVTGHKQKDKEGEPVRWDLLATAVDTLVIYMGVGELRHICQKLMEHGRPAHTPVALVRWGTLSSQETLVGNLANMADLVEKRGFKSPAIIVVGEVVRLREQLAWFEERWKETDDDADQNEPSLHDLLVALGG
jgi:uroporphyrin-III C-methyltransferase/uroporphyrinogen III methyltransferase/synthase